MQTSIHLQTPDHSLTDEWEDDDATYIEDYTRDSYLDVNERLRNGTKLEYEQQKIAEALTRNMRPLTMAQTVYRGMSNRVDVKSKGQWVEPEVGETYILGGFTSTSRDNFIAAGFADPYSSFIEMRVPTHTPVLTLSLQQESSIGNEHETILSPDLSIHIESIESRIVWNRVGGPMPVQYIVATVVPSKPKELQKSGEGTDWTKEHGLVFDPPTS